MHIKVTISFDTDSAEFDDPDNEECLEQATERVLQRAVAKTMNQLRRRPGCVCTAPEVDDVLMDINGNTIGSVIVEAGGAL